MIRGAGGGARAETGGRGCGKGLGGGWGGGWGGRRFCVSLAMVLTLPRWDSTAAVSTPPSSWVDDALTPVGCGADAADLCHSAVVSPVLFPSIVCDAAEGGCHARKGVEVTAVSCLPTPRPLGRTEWGGGRARQLLPSPPHLSSAVSPFSVGAFGGGVAPVDWRVRPLRPWQAVPPTCSSHPVAGGTRNDSGGRLRRWGLRQVRADGRPLDALALGDLQKQRREGRRWRCCYHANADAVAA